MEDIFQFEAIVMELTWCDEAGLRHTGRALAFDPTTHAWKPAADSLPGKPVTACEAVAALQRAGVARRLPVGVIGPHDARPSELAMAEGIGAAIAALGLPLLSGGRGGCMEAASRGAANAGGLVIGLLPSNDWMNANIHVHIPIATGIGEARNAIIASGCFALIAVGDGHGTLSEMALGLKMGRLVIAMPDAEPVRGAMSCTNVACAMDAVAQRYLALDSGEA